MRPHGFFIAALLLCNNGALATTIHRWVDAAGLTHFSDAPPPAGVVEQRSEFEILDDYPATVAPQDDYYSIANQWARLSAERNEKRRMALEEARLRASSSAPVPRPAANPEPRYAPIYPIFPRGFRGAGYRHHPRFASSRANRQRPGQQRWQRPNRPRGGAGLGGSRSRADR